LAQREITVTNPFNSSFVFAIDQNVQLHVLAEGST